jgi:hypothetical protein
VNDFARDTGTEPHATHPVDAPALPADGAWRLHVMDDTPGIFTFDPDCLDGRSLTF